MKDTTPYSVPQEPGRWRAIALAVLVHLALFAFLWIGVRWQSSPPTTIEAEVWSTDVHEAAPVQQPVKQAPPPPKPVEQAPPPPPPVKAAPQPEVKEKPIENPDIALEREKKRKAEEEKKKRLEQEREAQLKQKAEEERQAKLKQKAEEERQAKLKQKAEEERQAKLKKKAEEERLARQKAEEARIAKEKAAKKAAEEARRKKEEAQLAQAREAEMKRITSGVVGTGGTGDAARSSGIRGDSSYANRVQAKIKSNIVFNPPENLADNPAVEYEVDLLPDGSISGIRKLKSSGLPGWDEAVLRAIQKAQPYPKDKNGSVPNSFIGIHRPKDK